MSVASIMIAINDERTAQDAQWGGPGHDDTLTPKEWLALIDNRVAIAVVAVETGCIDDVRRRLVQITATTIAAIEALDRANRGGESENAWTHIGAA